MFDQIIDPAKKQKFYQSLEESGWKIEEDAANNARFVELAISKGKCTIPIAKKGAIPSVNALLEVFSFPSAKYNYGITIEQAHALFDSLRTLRKHLRIALTPSGVKRLWMRTGISFDFTLEEFAEVESESPKGEQILRKAFLENRCRLDGDSYSPDPEGGEDCWDHEEINYEF